MQADADWRKRLRNRTVIDLEESGDLLGTYRDSEKDVIVEALIGRDGLAIRTDEMSSHLWRVSVDEFWIARENALMSVTFRDEEASVVSFTRSTADGTEPLLLRVRK